MKISKSKQELARIISENGGWRDMAESAAQCKSDNAVSFYRDIPDRYGDRWWGEHLDGLDISQDKLIANWHQSCLSLAEYFFLYQEQGLEDALNEDLPDADGWIEWKGGECPVGGDVMVVCKVRTGKEFRNGKKIKASILRWRHTGGMADIISYRLHKPEQAKPEFCESVMRSIPEPEAKPTIEQLAADYRNAKDFAEHKQQEADSAKADADARLKVLEIAGEAIGLTVSPITAKQGPELVIADWRDLRVGDEVEYVEGSQSWSIGMVGVVQRTEDYDDGDMNVRLLFGEKGSGWPRKWRFIRRP